MASLPLKVLAATLTAVFALASPAEATKARKHKKVATAPTAVQGRYWGTNVFPAGPLYFSGVYLGDDPDPNIRFQIWRDVSGRLGGDSN
jgi:hypothetical protein